MVKQSRNKTGNYTYPNSVKLIKGGRDYFDTLLHIIQSAQHIIHLQTYIYENDETGTLIGNALKEATSRGVAVYMVIDGYASQSLDNKFVTDLCAAGIRFKFFEPLFKSSNFYFGRRLHHKLIVADDRYSLVGGINISNRYNDMDGEKAWLDFAVLMEGPVSQELAVLCCKTWNGFLKSNKKYKPVPHNFNFATGENALAKVRMRRNDWVKNKNQISKSYLEMFRSAKNEIVILCAYFIPGNAIRRSMVQAVKRGVKIKVIMTGMSDVNIAKNAERFMYAWLLRHKIEIYEYQKNILHGKVAVSDQQFVTMGSFNINDISAFASIELNVDIQNELYGKIVYKTLNHIMQHECIQLDNANYIANLNPVRKFISWISYQFVRFVFYLFTFYFRQEKRA